MISSEHSHNGFGVGRNLCFSAAQACILTDNYGTEPTSKPITRGKLPMMAGTSFVQPTSPALTRWEPPPISEITWQPPCCPSWVRSICKPPVNEVLTRPMETATPSAPCHLEPGEGLST
ncbi:hypothetical protein NDU88_003835 [Pleurodeles waltl]|uniref:Uncharacterized protein n=1 Tax=Pleurodeles waltl TaxID=8319 RepID=A0AAV7MTM6_PLEWA|nr:hypothetical protein NDU88_003835 [Pleurodeles waltl]